MPTYMDDHGCELSAAGVEMRLAAGEEEWPGMPGAPTAEAGGA